ncbi:response regulator [Salicibibacter cibi]|uniref:Response regulator n=1 Tax=Salicibibacter cibi TaxID=2743001 RepID=A0A7T6ZDC5_9BACI|nr:response regulator [Salicibibacter cibi]QQK81433.1 response regulator [Salicibibacter cibi]
MLKAILVDDEPLFLDHFEKLLAEINDGIDVVGKYINPHQALAAIFKEQPDVIFLDIEIPKLSGIEVAEKIQSSSLQTKFVFVTLYREYAVEAFELNAMDYLVKPVQQARLTKTIDRLSKDLHRHSMSKEPTREATLCFFRSIQFKCSGKGSKPLDVRWRTSKARELFAFLVHHRQKPVQKIDLIELLWPETDGDKGMTQLYASIYQIRKTIASVGFNIHITSHHDSYMLDLNGITFDVDVWEQRLSELSTVSDDTLPRFQALIDMYPGDYLEEYDYLWAVGERERLRSLWLRCVMEVTDFMIAKGNYVEALPFFHQVQERYPYMEDSYFNLIHLYDQLGDRYAVDQQYAKLEEMLGL